MAELILLRHASSEGDGLYTGWSDPSLSEKGISRASALSGHPALKNIDRIYTSPSARCLQTLSCLELSPSLPVIRDERLRELNFGHWEGLDYKTISRTWPEEWNQWCLDSNRFKPPGGENQSQLLHRTAHFLNERTLKTKSEKILICAHGGSLAAILKHLIFTEITGLYKIMPQRATLSTLKADQGKPSRLTSFNIAFLKRPC